MYHILNVSKSSECALEIYKMPLINLLLNQAIGGSSEDEIFGRRLCVLDSLGETILKEKGIQ